MRGQRPSASGRAPLLGGGIGEWSVPEAALVEAQQLQRLPDDYTDVTGGRFARWKRWIKTKLLGNFKRGYVDVLSRQQSQVNRHMMVALQHLTECCATLDHALRGLQERMDTLEERIECRAGHTSGAPAEAHKPENGEFTGIPM